MGLGQLASIIGGRRRRRSRRRKSRKTARKRRKPRKTVRKRRKSRKTKRRRRRNKRGGQRGGELDKRGRRCADPSNKKPLKFCAWHQKCQTSSPSGPVNNCVSTRCLEGQMYHQKKSIMSPVAICTDM